MDVMMTRREYLATLGLTKTTIPNPDTEATEEFKELMIWIVWNSKVRSGERDKGRYSDDK